MKKKEEAIARASASVSVANPIIVSGKRCKRTAMEKIEDKDSRMVTFSKRRSGLFKKALLLSSLCDTQVAVITFSAGRGTALACGYPSVDDVIDSYLGENHERSTSSSSLSQEIMNKSLSGANAKEFTREELKKEEKEELRQELGEKMKKKKKQEFRQKKGAPSPVGKDWLTLGPSQRYREEENSEKEKEEEP